MSDKCKTVEEILKMDTSKMSLDEMVSMLSSSGKKFADDVLKLRLRHEEDTGVPMEEDDMSEAENEVLGEQFKSITDRL